MQKLIPNLWFKGDAKEAVDYYKSIFKDFKLIKTHYYPTDGLEDFQKEFAGDILTIEFEILGHRLIAINAGPEFTFNEAISLLIVCEDQAEIDYYWDSLTKNGGEESQCGWLKDKFGLSWQVAPKGIDEMIIKPSAFQNLMNMKKIIIKDLENE